MITWFADQAPLSAVLFVVYLRAILFCFFWGVYFFCSMIALLVAEGQRVSFLVDDEHPYLV